MDGQPFVIPTGYARVDDTLYIHGSQASRMLRTLSNGVDACVTVTLVDGLVLARSAFHHSINYRSVVVFGRAGLVVDQREKNAALFAFSEQIVKGRWDDVREPTESELKQTSVLSLPLLEASAKVRTGPPIDAEDDYAMSVWAGVIPLRMRSSSPTVELINLRGLDAPSFGPPPSNETVESETLVTRLPVARSGQSFPIMPVSAG